MLLLLSIPCMIGQEKRSHGAQWSRQKEKSIATIVTHTPRDGVQM
jgi:hypothetical protein